SRSRRHTTSKRDLRSDVCSSDLYLEDGGTMLMVSHSMYQVQKLCRQALWLHQGGVAGYGNVFDVTQAYLAWHERKDARDRQAGNSRDPNAMHTIAGLALNDDSSADALPSAGDSLAL